MPPVTPSATRATLLLAFENLLDLALAHFALGDLDQFVRAGGVGPGRAAAQQLLGARAGKNHELEGILSIPINHCAFLCAENVSTISSAAVRIERNRARSARTLERRRSTQASSSSLTITYSYSTKAATSSRAVWSRRCIAASESLLRPRNRRSSISNEGGSTKTPTVPAHRRRT